MYVTLWAIEPIASFLDWDAWIWKADQAPFTSEVVGSILATDSCEKSLSTLCRKFSPGAPVSFHSGQVGRVG
jgi:hypothetical protein